MALAQSGSRRQHPAKLRAAGTMTSISQTVATAQARVVPKAKARNAALDRSRTFITLLVLVHNSVIAYTY
jgi:hypothetical protein